MTTHQIQRETVLKNLYEVETVSDMMFCKLGAVGINGYVWDDLGQNFQIFNHLKNLKYH